MPLPLPENTATQEHKKNPYQDTQKYRINPLAQQHAQTQADQAAPTHPISSTHAKHPPAQNYAEGCSLIQEMGSAAQIGLANLVRRCQFRTGAAEGNGAGLQDVGPVGNLQRLSGVLLHQQNGGA